MAEEKGKGLGLILRFRAYSLGVWWMLLKRPKS